MCYKLAISMAAVWNRTLCITMHAINIRNISKSCKISLNSTINIIISILCNFLIYSKCHYNSKRVPGLHARQFAHNLFPATTTTNFAVFIAKVAMFMANAMPAQYQYQVLNIFQCLIRRRQMREREGDREGDKVGNMLQESRRRLLHGLTVI